MCPAEGVIPRPDGGLAVPGSPRLLFVELAEKSPDGDRLGSPVTQGAEDPLALDNVFALGHDCSPELCPVADRRGEPCLDMALPAYPMTMYR